MYMFLLWYIYIYVFLILNFMLKVFRLRVIRIILCDYLIIISICFIDIVVIYVYSFE